jgi:membrane-bound lytic murein transglycosylase
MVPAVRRSLPWFALAACCAAAGALHAQDAGANSLPALQDAAAKRTAEWNTLTLGLELRLARMLPCDPRVRTAVDEVGRAADTRTVALTSYWNMVSLQSKAQVEAIRGLLTLEQQRAEDWATDKTEAEQEVAATSAQAAALKASLQQVPALANPQKSLESLVESNQMLAAQARERETNGGLLVDELRDLLKASQTRQSAIEGQLKSVSEEGQRWSAYYAARQARAQIECVIINPAAATAPPAARPAPPTVRPLPPGTKP